MLTIIEENWSKIKKRVIVPLWNGKFKSMYEKVKMDYDDFESLAGLGYLWDADVIYYAIGLKVGDIPEWNFSIDLPDEGWTVTEGNTDELQNIYREIYRSGRLKYEIETFTNDGRCRIEYYR